MHSLHSHWACNNDDEHQQATSATTTSKSQATISQQLPQQHSVGSRAGWCQQHHSSPQYTERMQHNVSRPKSTVNSNATETDKQWQLQRPSTLDVAINWLHNSAGHKTGAEVATAMQYSGSGICNRCCHKASGDSNGKGGDNGGKLTERPKSTGCLVGCSGVVGEQL